MMYSLVFDKAIQFLFLAEGGTNNDPDDRGGLTVYGISQKQYHDVELLKLTKEDAVKIYYQDYWLKSRCESMPDKLAIVMFDSSVNCGIRSAGRWLQKACNGKGAKLVVDGFIGPMTLDAISRLDSDLLFMYVLSCRLKRYYHIIKDNPMQIKYINGWINRVANLIFEII